MIFIATKEEHNDVYCYKNYDNDVYCYKTVRLKLAAPKSRLMSFTVTIE